ncbi:MAG: hypothetical protein GKR94_20315 [Gammaproteobacteria bacterium]|nr:hypothetical protein [Gammaproteobacteria bacterium]
MDHQISECGLFREALICCERETPEFPKKNPFAGVPILQLDNGTVLVATLPIMKSLEKLYPDPPLINRMLFHEPRSECGNATAKLASS